MVDGGAFCDHDDEMRGSHIRHKVIYVAETQQLNIETGDQESPVQGEGEMEYSYNGPMHDTVIPPWRRLFSF